MKALKNNSGTLVLGTVLILFGTTTFRASDNPASDASCEQMAVGIDGCARCNQALEATREAVTLNGSNVKELPKPSKPRHTAAVLGFVISGKGASENRWWEDGNDAVYRQFRSEGQPQGLRLFTWSW